MDNSEIRQIREYLSGRHWPESVPERRKVYDSLGTKFPIAPDISVESETISGVRVEWTRAPSVDRSRVVIYLHGGGYVYGSLESHRHLASEIGRVAGCQVLAVDYRLAPEHPFPAALNDVLVVYRSLLSRGISSKRIAFAGDSAGGGLSVAAMVALRDEGLPQPASGWLISPFTDLAARGSSYEKKASIDPAVTKQTVEFVAKSYLPAESRSTPLASVVEADLRGISPLLIFVGSHEVLLDDSVELCRAAGMCDVSVRLEIWSNMIHIWPTYYRILSEGRRAIESGARFINASMKAD
jgi:epsilon-lactone hydrolase